jgi:two-component system probable response regulator PhcQ
MIQAMEPSYDYKQFAILYVDDEEKSLKLFARAFEDEFRILTAKNAQDGFKLLEQHRDEIGLLMTDQKMPGEKGVWLLEQARQLEPRIPRVLVTAYTDYKDAIDAINTGAIYKYVSKPWDVPQLEITLKHGLEFFAVQRERDDLLREKLSVLQNLMIADRIVSLGLLAAGLSHHIRNSLVAVKTFLDLAPSKLADEKLQANSLRDPGFWKEYHQNVQSQIEKINLLLRELWTASERPALDFSDRVRLADAVTAAREKLRDAFAAKRLTVETDIPDSLPELRVDKPRFNRLFELLFKDELASLPLDSRVKVVARTLNGTSPEKAQVEIQVSDNGPGLPADALRLVFDPFVLRADRPAEFGINLMACYFIVHHHGGTIHAASDPARGTTFTIRLPLDPAHTTPSPDEQTFLQKAVLNDELWRRLAAAP